jgi:hypothetical protein
MMEDIENKNIRFLGFEPKFSFLFYYITSVLDFGKLCSIYDELLPLAEQWIGNR